MADKDYLLERINNSQQEIFDISKTINHYEAFRTLLCLLDAFTAAQIGLTRNIVDAGKTDEKVWHFYNNNLLYLQIIYKLIDYVLSNATTLKSTLVETPKIVVIIMESTFQDFPNSEELIAQKYDLRKAEVFYWDFNIHGDTTHYRRYFVIENGKGLNDITSVKQTIRLIQIYWRLLVAQTALTQNFQFEMDHNGKIKFLEIPDKIIQSSGIEPRSISIEHHLFPNWILEVIESHAHTMKNLDDLAQNRQNVLNEFQKKKFAFESLPNFKNLFSEYYKISFDDYFSIITELCMLAYDNHDRIIRLPRSRLIKQIKRYSGKSKELIEKILSDFTWQKGDTIFEKFLIYDGNNFTYSWDTSLYTTELPLNFCYEELFNNDLKGKRYEEESRKIFKTNSLFVCNGRLLILQQIVPTSFYVEHKSKVKKTTDLDVVGTKLDILFIIECKAKKKPIDMTHVYNELEKNYNELLWKTQWISEHKEDFLTIAKKQNYDIPDFNHVVPLLVTNIVSPDNRKYNSVNFSELSHILNDIQINSNSKYITKLPTGIEISVPVFRIKKITE